MQAESVRLQRKSTGLLSFNQEKHHQSDAFSFFSIMKEELYTMKFFIDTANFEEIKEAHSWGILSGVTTNPSLVAKENISFHDRLREITALVPGSVSAEVIALDAEGMIEEGRELAKIAPNITVKLPMTPEGLKACSVFAQEGIKTNVTLIFSANQALLAARAGATYVSPFLADSMISVKKESI